MMSSNREVAVWVGGVSLVSFGTFLLFTSGFFRWVLELRVDDSLGGLVVAVTLGFALARGMIVSSV